MNFSCSNLLPDSDCARRYEAPTTQEADRVRARGLRHSPKQAATEYWIPEEGERRH